MDQELSRGHYEAKNGALVLGALVLVAASVVK